MLIVLLIAAILLLGGGGLLLLLNVDRDKMATARRLKFMSAPPPSKFVGLDTPDTPRGDPMLHLVPLRFRNRVDDALGATGYAIKLRTLGIISVVGAIVFFLIAVLLHLSTLVWILALLIGAVLPPWQALKFLQKRHTKRFLNTFPDAIDLIVRAVRAGLPVAGALEATGREIADPVGLEFRLLTADMRIGIDLDEALHRANARIRLADFSFFVASLILQRESGGNLSETLSILSGVLRRRAELRLKIAAMTSEAKASAYVLSALPFMASGALAVLNPHYLGAFFVDPRGGYILGTALAMLMLGMFSMRGLIAHAAS